MIRFLLFILFVSQNTFANSLSCKQLFEDSLRGTKSDVVLEALSYSQFINIFAVETLGYELAQKGLITNNAADQLKITLQTLQKNNSKLFLRFKFAFNALETASREWDPSSLEKNNNQDLQKKLAYVAIWTLAFPQVGIGTLALRNNNKGYSIQYILQDSIFQADVKNTFSNFVRKLGEQYDPITGRKLLDRYKDPNFR